MGGVFYMASSSSSSSSSNPPPQKYDVFISFRGADTRDTFTSHLKAALGRKKIETYMDDKLGMGDKIGPALLQAIEKSKVRKQQDKRFEDNMDKVLMWRNALKEAADMSGFDNSKRTGTEADLIEKIAEDVLTKLNRASSSDLKDWINFIQGKLRKLNHVKGVSKSHGPKHLRNLLLRDILKEKDLSIDTKNVSPFIQERLSRTKVLIILDDVNDSSQSEYQACAGRLKFGPGSRIIITTRDRSLHKKTVHHDKIYKFGHKDGLISWALKIGVPVRDIAAALPALYVPQWASDQPAQPSHSAGQL
ncbi:Disease resistance protein TIR-NBS-LRR class family [Prunus dulcis]|uniref:Disease resistance protein TIR-NBS-LRR class family n=1 Tax=Prunus dulcis TaxID=3755 RepID=A0A4Y1RYU4_PRUDU|nr:Disease resistance protein TIR-NBS-LRR class family [Prunus dulcis]